MSARPPDTDAWAARQIRSTVGLAAWTIAWVGTLALAAFGPGALWNDESALTLAAIALNVACGTGMLFANKRSLEAMDELQRSIQLQAMGWSLGIGLVGGLAWTVMDQHGLVAFQAGIAQLVILMAAVYIVAIVVGTLRYR